jgi:hypothetical protein
MGRKTVKGNDGQMVLQFFCCAAPVGDEPSPRGGDNRFDALLRRAIAACLKGLERDAVAARMSELLGRQIKADALDQWCAPSQHGRRAHGDALLALMVATERVDVLQAMAGELGRQVLTEREAMAAEFGALTLAEHEVVSQRKSLAARLAQEGMGRELLAKVKGGGK